MAARTPTSDETRVTLWPVGFLGFIAILGFQAFPVDEPYLLYWFTCAGLLAFFGLRWPALKYLGLLGILGLVVAVLGTLGVFAV